MKEELTEQEKIVLGRIADATYEATRDVLLRLDKKQRERKARRLKSKTTRLPKR